MISGGESSKKINPSKNASYELLEGFSDLFFHARGRKALARFQIAHKCAITVV